MIFAKMIFKIHLWNHTFTSPELESEGPYLDAWDWLWRICLAWNDAVDLVLLRQLVPKDELCGFTHDNSRSHLFELVFNCQRFFTEADSLAALVAWLVLRICAEVWSAVLHSIESQVLGQIEQEAGIVTSVADLLLRPYPRMWGISTNDLIISKRTISSAFLLILLTVGNLE
mgnify:CR=1 FL=1